MTTNQANIELYFDGNHYTNDIINSDGHLIANKKQTSYPGQLFIDEMLLGLEFATNFAIYIKQKQNLSSLSATLIYDASKTDFNNLILGTLTFISQGVLDLEGLKNRWEGSLEVIKNKAKANEVEITIKGSNTFPEIKDYLGYLYGDLATSAKQIELGRV